MRKPLLAAALSVLFVPWSGVPASAATEDPLTYHSLTPCLLFDTRPAFGGEGIMASGETRSFHVVGSTSDFASQGGTAGGCGIPGFSGGQPQAQSVFINIVAVAPTGGGNLKAWPADEAEPVQGGVVNYQQLSPNLNNSNALALGVRQDSEGDDISIEANFSAVHVRGVALGYFDLGEGSFWALGGNAGTTPGTDFLGTTDNRRLELRVNGARALRIEPRSSPNLIGGWSGNSVDPGVVGATIGGGGCSGCNGAGNFPNMVTDDFGTVGGGVSNTASGRSATVGGGFSNSASATSATVGGGSGNTAGGILATVPGGVLNSAAGDFSLAAGRRAKVQAGHPGAFLFGDSTDADFTSVAADEFAVRASGGFRFRTDAALATGCDLPAGSGTFSCTSDRSVKTAFAPVDPRGVLQAVTEVPISTWAFQEDPSAARHMGPMAQDFREAFGLGSDERAIATVDADGVALAAIQGLHQELTAVREEVRGRSGTAGSGVPSGAWWAVAAAIGVLGFGLGRRSGGTLTS
jgi:hypothetical protein